MSYVFVLWFERNLFVLVFFFHGFMVKETFRTNQNVISNKWNFLIGWILVGIQNTYLKVLWPWGLEYWNFHTFIVKLQQKKVKQIIQALVNFFLFKYQHYIQQKGEKTIQVHNMLPIKCWLWLCHEKVVLYYDIIWYRPIISVAMGIISVAMIGRGEKHTFHYWFF